MAHKLSPKQSLLVFSLLLLDEEPSDSELKKKFAKAPKTYKELFDAGIIETFRKPRGRTDKVRLTDSGWGWAESNLGVALDTRSNGTKALQGLLGKLGKFIARENLRLASILSDKPINAPVKQPDLNHKDALRSAYLLLTKNKFQIPIRIADLATAVPGIAKETFLEVLKTMNASGDVFFMGNDDPLDTKEDDRLYVINIAGFDRYNVGFTR